MTKQPIKTFQQFGQDNMQQDELARKCSPGLSRREWSLPMLITKSCALSSILVDAEGIEDMMAMR